MNLHNISHHNLPLLRDYLQDRYGWEWEIVRGDGTLRFRTNHYAQWTVMPEDELRHYALEANVWGVRRSPQRA